MTTYEVACPWIMDVFDEGKSDEDAYDDSDDDEGNEIKDNVWDDDQGEDEKVLLNNKADWNSDDDSIMDIPNNADVGYAGVADFLGFYPYKEVIFLGGSANVAVAYHLIDMKVQYLGSLSINTYTRGYFGSLVYTPCLIRDN